MRRNTQFVGMNAWNAIGEDLKAVVNEVVRATSAEAAAHFLFRDMQFKQKFVNEMGGELVQLDEEALSNLRMASLEVVDDFSAQDPQYSGRLGEMLHEFLRITGRS